MTLIYHVYPKDQWCDPHEGMHPFVSKVDYDDAVSEVQSARQAEANAFRNRDSAIAENEKLRAALREISRDNFLYRSTQIAIKALKLPQSETEGKS